MLPWVDSTNTLHNAYGSFGPIATVAATASQLPVRYVTGQTQQVFLLFSGVVKYKPSGFCRKL